MSEQKQSINLCDVINTLRDAADKLESAAIMASDSEDAIVGRYVRLIHGLVRERSYATQISYEEGEFEWGGCVEFEDTATKSLVRIEHNCECESLLMLLENLHDLTKEYMENAETTSLPKRIDREGRDVTDLPGLWSETDEIANR